MPCQNENLPHLCYKCLPEMSANTSTTEPESNHPDFSGKCEGGNPRVSPERVGAKGSKSLRPLRANQSRKRCGTDVPGEKSPAS